MRVIAGFAKGRKLIAPIGMETRPTIDRIKESIFNIIMPYIDEAIFLDLFSGTGSIGIEALSRGAKETVFVDNNMDCTDTILKNLTNTKLMDKAKVMNCLCHKAIDMLALNNNSFDIIFLDPPYNKNYVEETVNKVLSTGILKDDGLLIIEQATIESKPNFNGLEITKERIYKTTSIYFTRRTRD